MGPACLLDTNVVIGFFDTSLPVAGQRFVAGLQPVISVITHIELFSNPRISATELAQLRQFVALATVHSDLDPALVEAAITVRQRHKVKTPDAIIAATALVRGLMLVTRNTRDFEQIDGLTVINPFLL